MPAHRKYPRGISCDVNGCDAQAIVRGWCNIHYQSWRVYGDPLKARRIGIGPPQCRVKGCSRKPRSGSGDLCEMHYYRIRRNGTTAGPIAFTHCQQCGASLTNKKRLFCSRNCSGRFYHGTPNTKECVVCGHIFAMKGHRICCSESCQLEHNRALYRETHKRLSKSSEKYRAGMHRGSIKGRLRTHHFEAEAFDPHEIFNRDNWTCGLCGSRISKTSQWPKGDSASVDHVVPLSVGGLHNRQNVQAAHLSCNLRKGARTIG